MAYLFIVENNIAKPNPETILITPFKELWERDSSEDKSQAIKEFTYIELMSSKRKTNPFSGYADNIRHDKIKEMYFDEDWEPDALIERGLVFIHEIQLEASPTYSYYLSVLIAAEKMKDFFREFDINEVNEKGIRTWKPRDITSAMTDTERVLQNLNSMKEKVEQEIFEQTKTRGNKNINPFEV